MTPGPLELAPMDERAAVAMEARSARLVQRKGVPAARIANSGRRLPERHRAVQVVSLISTHAGIVALAVSAAATVHESRLNFSFTLRK